MYLDIGTDFTSCQHTTLRTWTYCGEKPEFSTSESQSHLTVSVYMRNNTVHKEMGEDPLADEERMVQLGYYSVTKYG